MAAQMVQYSAVGVVVLSSNPVSAAESLVPVTPNVTQESSSTALLLHPTERDRLPTVVPPETFPTQLEFTQHRPQKTDIESAKPLIGEAILAELLPQLEQPEQEQPLELPHTPLPDVETELEETEPTPDPEVGSEADAELDNPEELNTSPEPDTHDAGDPELGILRLQERALAVERPPETVFVLGRLSYFRSDNILLDDIDPVDDQLVRGGVSLLAVPNLGPQTQLIASVGGNLIRYSDLGNLDYNTLEIRAGVRQYFLPRTYGELSWSNQQFFASDDGDRFLNDHSLRLSVGRRDRLTSRLSLDSFYRLRLSFAEPGDRSRVTNTLGLFLNYELQPNLSAGLDYQLVLSDFTQQSRDDAYHQVTAELNYNLSRRTRINLFAGFSFGRSSNTTIDFDSALLGIALNISLPLF